MNYCRKCQSDYEKPGTCNCFAPVQTAPYVPVPYVPYYPPNPWWVTPTYPYWGTTTTPHDGTGTITNPMPITFGGIKITGNNVTTDTVRAEDVERWSGGSYLT